MDLKIVSNNTLTKDVFLGGRIIDPLDFGTVENIKVQSKDHLFSQIKFIPKAKEDRILEKYNLTDAQYDSITETLKEELKSILF